MYPKRQKARKKEIIQELSVIETNISKLVQGLNATIHYTEKTQKELLVLTNTLKKRGIIDELALAQERTQIEDMIRMEKQATILGNKPEGDKP